MRHIGSAGAVFQPAPEEASMSTPVIHTAEELAKDILHIGSINADGSIGEPIFEAQHSGSWSFGPLTVDFSFAGSQITFQVKLAGITIGTGSLDATNDGACISGNAGVASVKLCLKADFSKKELTVNGQICVKIPIVGSHCKSFNQRIFGW